MNEYVQEIIELLEQGDFKVNQDTGDMEVYIAMRPNKDGSFNLLYDNNYNGFRVKNRSEFILSLIDSNVFTVMSGRDRNLHCADAYPNDIVIVTNHQKKENFIQTNKNSTVGMGK